MFNIQRTGKESYYLVHHLSVSEVVWRPHGCWLNPFISLNNCSLTLSISMKLVVQEDTSLYTSIKVAVLHMTIDVYCMNYSMFMNNPSFVDVCVFFSFLLLLCICRWLWDKRRKYVFLFPCVVIIESNVSTDKPLSKADTWESLTVKNVYLHFTVCFLSLCATPALCYNCCCWSFAWAGAGLVFIISAHSLLSSLSPQAAKLLWETVWTPARKSFTQQA